MKATTFKPVTDLSQISGAKVKNVFLRNPDGKIAGIKRAGPDGYYAQLTGTGRPVSSLEQEISKWRGVLDLPVPDNGTITAIYDNGYRLVGRFVPTGKTVKDYKTGGTKPERKVIID